MHRITNRRKIIYGCWVALTSIGLAPALILAAEAPKRKEPNQGGSVDLSSQDPQIAAQRFKLAPGYAINLFAAEKDFPELANPVAMAFDARGRLWVSTMPTYPQYQPPNPPNDKVIILEDADQDGKADQATVFADGLHLPTGLELGNGGLYVASQPNLLFLKDADGDGKADDREIILQGLGSEDSHHAVHAFVWGPDGGLYIHEGTFHASQIETPYGVVRLSNSGVFRWNPRTWQASVFVSYPFANPWGEVFDRWGQNFIADASGGQNYFGSPLTGQTAYPYKHAGLKTFIPFSVRPTAGCAFVSSRHFPPEAQGNFLFNNNIGFQGIKQYKVREEGSGYTGEEIENLLESTDPNFRPVALRFAPDGSLYIVDWFNPLIGHMQFSLRDARRDHAHGRIWRITYPGRPLLKPLPLSGARMVEVLDALKEYEDEVRYRARRELNERNRDTVVAALKQWLAQLNPADTNHEHDLLEGLWVYQTLNVVNGDAQALLRRLLNANEPRVRAAATRALRFWLDRINEPLALLRERMGDDFPRVRLETLLTLSFFGPAGAGRAASSPAGSAGPGAAHPGSENPNSVEAGVAAAEIALRALNGKMDDYLEYVLAETMQALGPSWKPAIASGAPFAAGNPNGLEYALHQISVAELARAARSEPVYHALLEREGVEPRLRREALSGLAKARGTADLDELAAAISRAKGGALADLTRILAQWEPGALAKVRGLVERLATNEREARVRQAGFVAMMRGDGAVQSAWNLAAKSAGSLTDLLNGTALVTEANLLDELYPRTLRLLSALPPELEAQQGKPVSARYVRIELPGASRTLTLAEVQVFSGGKNIALGRQARQSATAYGGAAGRAIDDKTNGEFSAGTSTHTPEDQPNPWWEVDLGAEQAIDKIVVWNRTDDDLGKRLDNFRVVTLDRERRETFRKENNPAPRNSDTIELSGDVFPAVRHAAIAALGWMRGRDAEIYSALSGLLLQDIETETAIRALGRLKREAWPRANFEPVAVAAAAHAAKVPMEQRVTPEFSALLDLGRFLAGALPAGAGDRIRAQLKSLEVQVITIKTVEEQMRFDVRQFYVEAGRPVEIIFENPDIMPHNLIVVAPDAQMEVGRAADALGAAGFAKDFVPNTPKVLHHTRLIPAKTSERLRFIAPAAAADYPYLCTFPGHWLVMNGVMTVVPPNDSKAGEIVRGPKQTEALPPIADLVKLPGNVDAGAVVFARTCAICHKIRDVGVGFAPNLNQVGSRLTREQIIRSLLEPNAEIAKGNETVNIETNDGETFSGLVQAETPQQLQLRIGGDAIQTVAKAQVKRREVSRNSGMPQGLEQTMSREELIDLVEYLAAQK
jgi:putative heme-binding domain-containing protein